MPILAAEPQAYPESLFGDADDAVGLWMVAYVRSRQEKRLARHLREYCVAHFLPQCTEERTYRNRTVQSHLPLFPGYVFVRGNREEKNLALASRVIVNFLPVDDPERLKAELESLWRLQLSGTPLVPHPYLAPGDQVRVTGGPLAGTTGTVVRERNATRLIVSISLLKQAVAAEVDRDLLEPADSRRQTATRPGLYRAS